MKNKKSILSVLLAAVLLCACVAGMLVFGAQAEGNNLELTVAEGESIAAAIAGIPAGEKEGKDAIVITLEGNAVEADAATLFSETNVGLPIIINGSGKTVTANVLSAGPITSVNDITLNGVTLVTDATQLNLGNRKVVLNGATIPVPVLLNDSDVTADSSLTIQGATNMTGNVMLVAGTTEVKANVTTSLVYQGTGAINGILCGATDDAVINGTLDVTVSGAKSSFQDRFYGIADSVTVNGILNFKIDGGDINRYKKSGATSYTYDRAIAVYGFTLAGKASCPVINGTVNFTVTNKKATNSTTVHAVYYNCKFNDDAILNIDATGEAKLAQKYMIFGNDTGADLKLNGTINVRLHDFVAKSSFYCFDADTTKAAGKMEAATSGKGIRFNLTMEGNTSIVGVFYGLGTGSNSVKVSAIKATVFTQIKGGTYGAEVRPVSCMSSLNGDITCHVFTTEAWDSDVNVDGAEITFKSQLDLGWSSKINGTSTLKLNGGTKRNILYPTWINSENKTKCGSINGAAATNANHSIRNTDPDATHFKCNGLRNGTTGVVVNYIENAKLSLFGGVGVGNKALSSTAVSVTNTLKNVTIDEFYGFIPATANTSTIGDVTNYIQEGCVFTKAMYASCKDATDYRPGSITGTVTTVIDAGTEFRGDAVLYYKEVAHTSTIKGGTFMGVVSGGAVALAEGAQISICEKGQINATAVEGPVTITKTDVLGDFSEVYVTAPANETNITFLYEGETAPAIVAGDYAVRGWYLNPEISLILGQRVELKAILDKALADEYIAKIGTPAFTFKLGGVDQAVSADKLVENGENYEVIFAAAGAGDFDLPLEYVFSGKSVATTTIQELAAAGANIYKDTPNEAIFKALVDYGAAANGAAELTYFDAASLDLSKLVVATGAVKGETELQLSGITLLMGDTLGIRYKLSGEAAGVAVKFNGEALAADLYAVSGNNVDIFVSAETLNNLMPVEILDASGNTVVAVDYAVSNIAAKIYEADNTNLKAAAVLELVLAMEAAKTVA